MSLTLKIPFLVPGNIHFILSPRSLILHHSMPSALGHMNFHDLCPVGLWWKKLVRRPCQVTATAGVTLDALAALGLERRRRIPFPPIGGAYLCQPHSFPTLAPVIRALSREMSSRSQHNWTSAVLSFCKNSSPTPTLQNNNKHFRKIIKEKHLYWGVYDILNIESWGMGEGTLKIHHFTAIRFYIIHWFIGGNSQSGAIDMNAHLTVLWPYSKLFASFYWIRYLSRDSHCLKGLEIQCLKH